MYTSLRTYLQSCAPYMFFKNYTTSQYKAFVEVPLDEHRIGDFSIRWKLTEFTTLDKGRYHKVCKGIDTDIYVTDDILSIKFHTFISRNIIDTFVKDMSYADIFSEEFLSNLSMQNAPRELLVCLSEECSYHTIKFHMKDTYIPHKEIMKVFPTIETKDKNYYTCNIVHNAEKYRFSILQNQRFINLRRYEEGFHGIRSIGTKEGRNITVVPS